MSPISQIVYGFITLGLCWVLACRIDKMNKGVTQPAVFLQHFLLALGVFASWLLTFTEWWEWAPAVLAAGVLQFFMFSLKRWRKHAPDDTVRGEISELPREHWHRVAGGKR